MNLICASKLLFYCTGSVLLVRRFDANLFEMRVSTCGRMVSGAYSPRRIPSALPERQAAAAAWNRKREREREKRRGIAEDAPWPKRISLRSNLSE